MNILAIDLGTKTGFAFNHGERLYAGTWELAKPKEINAWGKQRLNRRKDPRVKRLCDYITAMGNFDALVFEDVQFTKTTFQAHLWSGLRSSLWLCGMATTFECVPVTTLKLFATGNGASDKSVMARFLAREPRFAKFELDGNGVDAAWLWIWADKNLTRISP